MNVENPEESKLLESVNLIELLDEYTKPGMFLYTNYNDAVLNIITCKIIKSNRRKSSKIVQGFYITIMKHT